MRQLPYLSPSSTALVVVDLQGSLSQHTYPRTTEEVLNSASLLIAAARDTAVKVIHVHAGNEPDGLDWIFADTEDARPRRVWTDEDMQIHPRVAPCVDDLVITKRQWGAFYGTGLEMQLRRRGLDTLLLCGIATNYAVESTARDAWERGFRLVFVDDAMAGLNPGDHEFAMARIFARLGRILSTDDTIRAMRGTHR